MTSKQPSLPLSPSLRRRLLRAAVAGLVSGSIAACSSSSSSVSDSPSEQQPKVGMITSTEYVGALSEADFQAMCDEAGGTVEALAHCGGLASAAGFAYDTNEGTISKHSCAQANTCGGWNCITDS